MKLGDDRSRCHLRNNNKPRILSNGLLCTSIASRDEIEMVLARRSHDIEFFKTSEEASSISTSLKVTVGLMFIFKRAATRRYCLYYSALLF